MERWREDFCQKGKTYQKDVFSWCIQGALKLLDVMQPSNQPANSIVFGCLSPSFCIGNS